MSKLYNSQKGDIIEVKLMYDSSDTYFKMKARISNLYQMKILTDSLREKGVIFPE